MRMMIRCLGLLLFLSLPALAQDVAPLDLSKVPTEGKAPKDFVPSGWKIEDTIKGDLDKNGSEDVVLQLISAGPEQNADGQPLERARALLALVTEGGKLRRAGASDKVLYCTTCAGMLSAPGAGQVKLQKGVILVDQLSGSREMMHTTLRFRYEPKDKRFVLIGEDVERTDRLDGSGERVSTNLLTGDRITEKLRYEAKKEKTVTVSSKKDKATVKKSFLEDADISTY